MEMALSAKNKSYSVEGSFPRPEGNDPILLSSWRRNDSVVRSWLLNSVSKDIVASIIHGGSVSVIWSNHKLRFQQSNGPRQYHLKKQLTNLTQGSFIVIQYFTKLKSLWK